MAKEGRAGAEVNARIVYWGISGAGKSTNLRVIHAKLRPDHRSGLREIPTRLDPTASYEVLPIELGDVGGVRTRMEIVSVPGGPEQAPTRKGLLDRADGVVFVIDAQRDRIDENVAAFEELRRCLTAYGRALDDVPIVLQYNKRDLADPYALEELHRKLDVRGAAVFEAVAHEGTGVLQTLTTLSKRVIRSLREGRARAAGAVTPLAPPPPEPLRRSEPAAAAPSAPPRRAEPAPAASVASAASPAAFVEPGIPHREPAETPTAAAFAEPLAVPLAGVGAAPAAPEPMAFGDELELAAPDPAEPELVLDREPPQPAAPSAGFELLDHDLDVEEAPLETQAAHIVGEDEAIVLEHEHPDAREIAVEAEAAELAFDESWEEITDRLRGSPEPGAAQSEPEPAPPLAEAAALSPAQTQLEIARVGAAQRTGATSLRLPLVLRDGAGRELALSLSLSLDPWLETGAAGEAADDVLDVDPLGYDESGS